MFTLPWPQILAEILWIIGAVAFMGVRLGPQLRAKRQPVKVSRRPATDFILVRLNELSFGVLPLGVGVGTDPSGALDDGEPVVVPVVVGFGEGTSGAMSLSDPHPTPTPTPRTATATNTTELRARPMSTSSRKVPWPSANEAEK